MTALQQQQGHAACNGSAVQGAEGVTEVAQEPAMVLQHSKT